MAGRPPKAQVTLRRADLLADLRANLMRFDAATSRETAEKLLGGPLQRPPEPSRS